MGILCLRETFIKDDESLVDTIVERLEMNKTMIYFQSLPLDNNLAMLAQKYDWYVDNSLGDNEIRVETHTTQSDSGENNKVEKIHTYISAISLSQNPNYRRFGCPRPAVATVREA